MPLRLSATVVRAGSAGSVDVVTGVKSGSESDPLAYKSWTPAAQQRALDRLRQLSNDKWRPFYCTLPICNGLPHDDWTWNHARTDQHPPKDTEWLVWLAMSGRGSGKTRQGSEYVHRVINNVERVLIVGGTSMDLRDVLVEGESGLLATAPPGRRPEFEPSKRRLTWPNGAQGLLVSAEEPDRLRGPQHGFAWLDEAAFFPLIDDVWSNMLFGLRLGRSPKVMVTTTPSPRKWLKELLADDRTRLSRASTYDNLQNLAPTYAERIIKRYEGTRLGRQELHAELLTDVEGALWTWDMIEMARINEPPADLQRIVVGVDPAGTSRKGSDETGIIVAGIKDGVVYILDDRSGRYTPHGWATVVRGAYDDYSADAIIAETNYGGEMVENTLRTSGVTARLIKVSARRSKSLRAEPVVGLYEQGKVKHCGTYPELETQMTEWVQFDGNSPDRLDAMVYAVTYVSGNSRRADIASPLKLIRSG